MFAHMDARGLAPSVKCYSGALSSCIKAGQFQEALNLMTRFESSDLGPDASIFAMAVSAAEMDRNGPLAYRYILRMQVLNLPVSDYTYGCGIRSCLQGGHTETAAALKRAQVLALSNPHKARASQNKK